MAMNFKDLRIGALFVAVGLFFGLYASFNITIGAPARMGPGFFPVLLSTLLVVLGLAICVRAFATAPSPMRIAPPRALLLVLIAPIVFGLTLRWLGLVPAVALTVMIAALASVRTSLARAAIIAACLTLLCTLIFHYGIGIPVELFGPALQR